MYFRTERVVGNVVKQEAESLLVLPRLSKNELDNGYCSNGVCVTDSVASVQVNLFLPPQDCYARN